MDRAIDYTQVFDLPPEGWHEYRRQVKMGKGYQPIPSTA